MPRKTTLRLETHGKHTEGLKVDRQTGWLLTQNGWTVNKRTRDYWFVEPSSDRQGGRTIELSVNVPSDEEIIAAANQLRDRAKPGERQFEVRHGWPFLFTPAHTSTTIIQETDVIGLNGPDWLPPPPEISTVDERPVCWVGFVLIWQIEVRWRENGTPFLIKYTDREISVDEQLSLFDKSGKVTGPIPPTRGEDNAERPTLIPEEVRPGDYVEGAVESVLVNAYERNPAARQACIEFWGARCQVCDFDFGDRYGPMGRGFIHIHHIKPLAEIGHEYRVNPTADLRPVCPNCHAMLHRQTPCLTIEQLRAMIRSL
jgi:hypothetical protein